MKNCQNRQQKIINEFSAIHGWEARYKKIIDIGKSLTPLADELKKDELKVKGCQSQVWIHATLDEKGSILFQGDSDALIVRGLVSLVLQIYSGCNPDEILETEPTFIKEIGLESHLSPSRTNGLSAMIRQIKYYAAAFKTLQERKL